MNTTFPEDGFFSEAAERWRTIHRKRIPEWLDLTHDLNRFGQELKADITAKIGPAPQHRYLAGLLYLRALSTFQASLILGTYGLLSDMGTLIRSCLEDFLILGMLEKDPDFVKALIHADALQEKKKLAAFLKLPPDLGFGPERTEQMRRYIDSFPNDLTDIKFEQIARKAGIGHMYDTYYRGLSHNSAHPNIQALMRHVCHDLEGNAVGFRYGPDVPKDELLRLTAYACAVFYCVVCSTISTLGDDGKSKKLAALYERYSDLARRDFPEVR